MCGCVGVVVVVVVAAAAAAVGLLCVCVRPLPSLVVIISDLVINPSSSSVLLSIT